MQPHSSSTCQGSQERPSSLQQTSHIPHLPVQLDHGDGQMQVLGVHEHRGLQPCSSRSIAASAHCVARESEMHALVCMHTDASSPTARTGMCIASAPLISMPFESCCCSPRMHASPLWCCIPATQQRTCLCGPRFSQHAVPPALKCRRQLRAGQRQAEEVIVVQAPASKRSWLACMGVREAPLGNGMVSMAGLAS